MPMQKAGVAYVADMGQDIDDLVTACALHDMGVLRTVVLDPLPVGDREGMQRVDRLVADGIPLEGRIPDDATDILVGGALGKVAEFLDAGGRIRHLVVNGGFAGANIVTEGQALRKFRNRESVRTYNFNLDIVATDRVLSAGSDEVESIMLVGKNVCHSRLNTTAGIWRDSAAYLARFGIGPHKRLHDLLMACEGLVALGMIDVPLSCEYDELYPFADRLDDMMTRWGSSRQPTEYRKALVATGWVDEPAPWNLANFMT